MRVAYITNRYPATSHSFIRREILALEALGVVVDRYSIRSAEGAFVDPSDAREAAKTQVVLGGGRPLLGALTRVALRDPKQFASALALARRFAARSDRGLIPNGAYLAEACVLFEHLRRTKVEHLHAHFGTNSAAVAALCRKLGGPSYSFTVHGPEEFDRAPLLGLSEKIEGAKFVAAISEYGRSQLCRLVAQQHWEKIRVVRCGLQRDLLARSPAPIADVKRLVCVGRLHEQKGHLVLIDAAKELKARGYTFHLVLAGDGPLRPTLEEHISRLGLTDVVEITGWLTEQQVIEQLEAACMLVLPSFAEGLPVVLMEALALGRPVISTFVAGIPELVIPEVNGWLVPAGSVGALADAIAHALALPAGQLEEMGKLGKRSVQSAHDISNSAAQLHQLFMRGAS